MSRRRVILGLGLGALAVAGGGTAAMSLIGTTRRQEVLHDLRLDPGPDNHVPRSNVVLTSGQLASKAMGRSVGWSLSTPTHAARAVVFCLHGKDADHRFAFSDIHLQDVVETLQAPLAVAAVDGGADSYWHRRADGSDALSMLLQEFIPLVEERTMTSQRALLGWSMGGYGSLLAAETSPDRFFAVAAASPALWTSPGQTAPGAFDGAVDYHHNDVYGHEGALASVAVRVDCGTGDPFYAAARRFVANLPPSGHGVFGPGFHEASYWRSVAPGQIRAITDALPSS